MTTYICCFVGSFERRDSKLSSRVPRIVIFLRVAEEWRCLSGPDGGNEPLSVRNHGIDIISKLGSFIEFPQPWIRRGSHHCKNNTLNIFNQSQLCYSRSEVEHTQSTGNSNQYMVHIENWFIPTHTRNASIPQKISNIFF